MRQAYKYTENRHEFMAKLSESARSVLPIVALVAVMCLLFVPAPTDLMLAFLIGSVMLVFGMTLFTMGSESSLTSIGSHMGSTLTKSKNLPLIIAVSFALGVFITMA